MRLSASPLNLALRRSVARAAFMRCDYFYRQRIYKFSSRPLVWADLLGCSRRKFKLAKRIFKFLVAGKSVNQTPGLLLIFFHYPFCDGFADVFVAFFVKG